MSNWAVDATRALFGKREKIMSNREKLDAIELEMARDDDRSVGEYRERYPENVVAIDTLRAVLDDLDHLDAFDLMAGAVFRIRSTIERELKR
jgi:hypothetical protein